MIQPISHLIAGVFFILAIASCAEHDSRCATLPAGGQYCLQATSALAPFEIQQKVDFYYQGNHETMIAYIENDSENLNFVGLTPFGQKLIHVNYNNQQAKAIISPDKRLAPSLMIALLQLALWPTASVQTGLSAEFVVEESDGHRRIFDGTKLLMDVRYANGTAPYQQLQIILPAAGMKLDIVSLAESDVK